MAKPLRPWFKTDAAPDGDRTLAQQMQGLNYLMAQARAATVLDVGCAEGLIGFEMAKAGAVYVHGVEIRAQAIRDASQSIPEGVNTTFEFEVADVNVWVPTQRYDIVVMLAILHKLKEPAASLSWFLSACDDMAVIRLPPRNGNPSIYDARSGSKHIDLWPVLRRQGFRLVHRVDGYLDEWIGYYRKRTHG